MSKPRVDMTDQRFGKWLGTYFTMDAAKADKEFFAQRELDML